MKWIEDSYNCHMAIRLAIADSATGIALAMQSMAIREDGTAVIFGTMRQPWWRWLRLLWRARWRPMDARRAFLDRFEEVAREHGARRLVGFVPVRIWRNSYNRWTGFKSFGRLRRHGVDLVRIEKDLK